jgi:coenzyme F420 hydrogenase subunit beta
MVTKIKGMGDLFKEVIDVELCAVCGACVGDCPYTVFYKGKIRMTDFCTRTEGHCWEYCPRTHTVLDDISKMVFNSPYADNEIGTFKEIVIARAKDKKIRDKGQYGGTVTALLTLALNEGLINKAILSRTNEDKQPEGAVVKTAKELLECAGSNYMAYPALEELNRMPKDSKEKLGIVLTPCQSIALAKMRFCPPAQRIDLSNIRIVLGLFCTWALDYGRFYEFLKDKVDIPKIKKFDIPPPPANRFDVYIGKEVKSFSLDEVRNYRMKTCAYCLDMTAEFADISVGAVEGIEGWNTVIVRTERGASLLETAKKNGIIETDKLPAKILEHLKEAAMLKKSRGLKECVKRTGNKDNELYLHMDDKLRDKLLAWKGQEGGGH